MSRALRIMAAMLFVGGGLLGASGLWIPAKAILAQSLLQRAWQKSLATSETVKPWPWADTWPVARLRNARLGVDLIVLEGESGEVLAFGPGHLSRSGLPDEGGHIILAGHRDTSFEFLKDLEIGDRLVVEGEAKTNSYLVQSTTVVSADKLYLDGESEGTLTLITCYPFGSLDSGATLRFVVTARLDDGFLPS